MDSTFRATLAARRSALLGEWFQWTVGAYPPETARVLSSTTADRFRNPAGHLLREGLATLFDAAILSEDWETASRALDDLMRLRAVQGLGAERAVAFIDWLKPIVNDDSRIGRLGELARVMYERSRARVDAVRANEQSRRTWNPTRVRKSDVRTAP